MAGLGQPVEKPKNFRGTLLRLARYMSPDLPKIGVVVVFAILSTLFSVVAPKLLGRATTAIFNGVIAKFTAARAHHSAPSLDFGFIGQIALELIALYIISSVFSYAQQYLMAGIAQRTVYGLRRDVDAKLARLPLRFFDARTHGEILSR